jgi:hypothetical protein
VLHKCIRVWEMTSKVSWTGFHWGNVLFLFLVVMGFKLRALCLLGRCCTTYSTPTINVCEMAHILYLYFSLCPPSKFHAGGFVCFICMLS